MLCCSDSVQKIQICKCCLFSGLFFFLSIWSLYKEWVWFYAAFAPVLLPSRVVQALNLNVHGLGLQIKPRGTHIFTLFDYDILKIILSKTFSSMEVNLKSHWIVSDYNNNVKGLECDRIRNKKSRDVSSQFCVISQNRSSSPEIFLPKEWTY